MKTEYEKIYRWYKDNENNVRGGSKEYQDSSRRLIRSLPLPEAVSDVEMKAVFLEVTNMFLEWAYNESDGQATMSEYAKEALSSLPKKDQTALTETELEELRKSRIWPYTRPGQRRE